MEALLVGATLAAGPIAARIVYASEVRSRALSADGPKRAWSVEHRLALRG